jgi:hypothetical protein
VLAAAGHRCRACPETAQEVHHRDYRPRVLEGNDHDALVALCISCHDRVETVRKKQSWNAADRLLDLDLGNRFASRCALCPVSKLMESAPEAC